MNNTASNPDTLPLPALPASVRAPVFIPSDRAIELSQMTAFARSLGATIGLDLRHPARLHDYSVRHFRAFWSHLLEWSELRWEGSAHRVCEGDACETASFFPDVRLNYAENLLDGRHARADAVAVTSCRADGRCVQITRAELHDRVERLAEALREHGVGVGDCVVAVLRNDGDAVVAALAVAAIGASLATAAPEMGAQAIIERFQPLAPRLLIAHVAALEHDTGVPVAARVAQVAAALEALTLVVTLDDTSLPLQGRVQVRALSELLASHHGGEFYWQRFAFNQALFVMASSGTTGPPKLIVHGAGGALIEHVKEHRLHCDLGPADTLFFQTSCSWMMWHWQLSALASGCGIVLYDGPIRDAGTLWRIVEERRVTVFGTSPPYLKLCQDAGLSPGRAFELGALRAVLSTGSVLHDPAYTWVHDEVKAVPLQSISGGTDILGCFVLGHPNLPVYPGQSQSKSLGLDVRAAPLADRASDASSSSASIGELICANPFPSRPLGFHGDADGARFHASYFARNPGVWTHGDLIEFSADGMARLHGRSDGVMNIRGIRVGPAEIYRVVCEFEAVRDAMVVEQTVPAEFSAGRAVLLLVMREGAVLDGALIARLRRRLAEVASSAHVPDVVLQVADLPCTHSHKPSEAAMTDVVNGRPVRNLASLRNPGCLAEVRDAPALRASAELGVDAAALGLETEARLQRLWEALFSYAPIGLDDDFFELGGHSLLAARLFGELQTITGQRLELTTLLLAPTIRQLARVIDTAQAESSARLVQLRPGSGRPFFLVHSMAGTFLELWAVLRVLDTRRPIYGIQARGTEPHVCVSDMADDYLRLIRDVQPDGPYAIGGYSFGGLVAFEIAHRLLRAGETVERLGLIDTQVDGRYLPLPQWLRHRVRRMQGRLRTVASLPLREQLQYVHSKSLVVLDRVRGAIGLAPLRPDLVGNVVGEANLPRPLRRVRGAMLLAMRAYRPAPYPGAVVFLRASAGDADSLPVWRKVVQGGLEVRLTPGNHDDMLSGSNARALASELTRMLEAR